MAERLDRRMCRFALQLFFLIEIHTAWILQVTSAWLYPENREYRIYFASAVLSECYTTHMGDTPGLHRSLTAPTPSGRRVSKEGRRQKAGGCVCNSRNANRLRAAPGFSVRLNELACPGNLSCIGQADCWRLGRLTGDSPDTRRTLAGDNIWAPRVAASLRRTS